MLPETIIDKKRYNKLTPATVSVVRVLWQDITDSLEDTPMMIKAVTVGYLLQDDEDFVVLAHSWDPIELWSGWSAFNTQDVLDIRESNERF